MGCSIGRAAPPPEDGPAWTLLMAARSCSLCFFQLAFLAPAACDTGTGNDETTGRFKDTGAAGKGAIHKAGHQPRLKKSLDSRLERGGAEGGGYHRHTKERSGPSRRFHGGLPRPRQNRRPSVTMTGLDPPARLSALATRPRDGSSPESGQEPRTYRLCQGGRPTLRVSAVYSGSNSRRQPTGYRLWTRLLFGRLGASP